MHKPKKLIIFGDSTYAEMIAHYFRTDSPYEVAAFCVDKVYRSREYIDELPVYTWEELPVYCPKDTYDLFVAIGYKSMRTRERIFERVSHRGYSLASYISTRALVDETAKIGENALVLPGATIEPYAILGANCCINARAVVCHHVCIGSHTVLASGSVVGAYADVGRSSLIGFNATVTEMLHLQEETHLGANSLLLSDTKAQTLYVGSPAYPLRSLASEGIVLKAQR